MPSVKIKFKNKRKIISRDVEFICQRPFQSVSIKNQTSCRISIFFFFFLDKDLFDKMYKKENEK